MEKKKKSYIRIFFTAIVIYIICYILFNPPPPRRRIENPLKSCYTNLRIIQGAVEMYNMDHEKLMTDLDMKLLIDGHYLKNEPRKPLKECYYYSIDNISENGEICCELHGGLIAAANSNIARKKEIEQQSYEREKQLKELNNKLFLNTMCSTCYLLSVFCFAIKLVKNEKKVIYKYYF